MKTITSYEIKKYIDNGDKIAFVEAMQEKYFAEGHLPGAVSIVPEKIKEVAPKYFADKDQFIVTYCANNNCQNSKTAAETLYSLGYKNVAVYTGGKEDWKKAGFTFDGVNTDAQYAGTCGGTKKTGGCH